MRTESDDLDALGLGALAPLDLERPVDGPRTFHGRDSVIAWTASEARIRDERAGHDRSAAHPLRPRLVASSARAIAFEVAGDVDRIDALAASIPRDAIRVRATVRDHLERLALAIAPARALGRALGRARADRLLARELDVATGVGPILGGIDPRWIASGRSLSWRRARPDGWAALDLAAADAHGLADLREAHEQIFGDAIAYDLALLALLAAESVVARGEPAERATERVNELADRLAPRDRATTARVRIDAPPWLDASRWEGDAVPAAQARWALRELDGLSVGGTVLRVHVDPPLRAGRAAPPWRPQDERRRELFSRWHDGIRADDEGLWSATPEAIADRIASGLSGVVIDGTCGIGSIAIALARSPSITRVIAVDLDRDRLALARHNASIYGVADRIEWIAADVASVIATRAADALVLDPPWGGRDYDRTRVGLADLPLDLRPLLARFTGPIVLKLPRSFDVAELGAGWSIEPAFDPRGVLKLLIARRA